MVDYNSQQTISTPPGDILKIAILERRHYVIEAIRKWKAQESRGNEADLLYLKSGLLALFLELEPSLRGDLGEDKVEKMFKGITSDSEKVDEFLAIFNDLNRWLYSKNLTKFDTRKAVDHTDVEAVNKNNGF